MILNNIVSSLKDAKSIAIMPHISVDGDGLGSSLALGAALGKAGKDAVIYLEEDIPYIYGFLPGKDMVKVYNGEDMYFDTVIALDTGDMERLGKRADIFRKARITINVDHHNTNSEFAFYNYINTNSSAVGEIVYQMIKMMGQNLDSDMAECLYVAIATDTGGFRYSNTTALTHQIAADLINSGVNVAEISQKIFDITSYEKVKLTGEAVNSLELLENGKVAFITLTDEMMRRAGASEEDCEGIVNLGRNIRGVEVAVLMRQRSSGVIKVNLRSKNYVDVSAIANLYKGGGHKRAAGCIIDKYGLDEARKRIIEDIKEEL